MNGPKTGCAPYIRDLRGNNLRKVILLLSPHRELVVTRYNRVGQWFGLLIKTLLHLKLLEEILHQAHAPQRPMAKLINPHDPFYPKKGGSCLKVHFQCGGACLWGGFKGVCS